MLFGKKTKIYAPNISANVEADVDAKMKKGGEKGAKALMAALKSKGYKNGGEKLLTKMTYGGASMDMSDPMVKRMQMGGSTANTYSSPKKKK